MFAKRLAAAALFAVLSLPAFAQNLIPPSGSRPGVAAPSVAAPSAPAQKPAMAPMNVNTATAKDLDKLPSIGKARAAAIVNERGKGPFKDWADFDKRMTGTNVNAGVKAKIKDLITF